MTHCEKCIHHDICKIDAYLMPEDFVNFFPHNEDCEQFKPTADVVEVRQVNAFIQRLRNTTGAIYHLELKQICKEFGFDYSGAKMDGGNNDDI